MKRVLPFLCVWCVAAVSRAVAPPDAWPSFRGDPAQTGVASSSLPAVPKLRWTTKLAPGLKSSPVVEGGRLFLGTSTGHLVSLSSGTGKVAWDVTLDGPIEAPALVHQGTVYVGTLEGGFHARSAETGAPRWSVTTGDKILGGAAVVEAGGRTLVVVGSYDHSLHAYFADDGKPAWALVTGDYLHGAPSVWGTRLVIGGCDGKLHVVDATTGTREASIELGGQVAASPAIDGDDAFLGTYGNHVLGIDLVGAAVFWRFRDLDFPFVASAALGPTSVFVGGRDRRMHALDRETGARRWSTKLRARLEASPVLLPDGRLVVVAMDGRLQLLRGADGVVTWTHVLGADVVASPAVAGGRLFVAALDGRVLSFGERPAKVRR